MLHNYRFSNFYSFIDDVSVDFRMPKTFSGPAAMTHADTATRLTKAMAVLGHNGGGKTNLIKPLAFIHWLVSDSFRSEPDAEIPIETHFFSNDDECSFDVEAEVSGELLRYSVTMTKKRILSESLHRKTRRTFSYIFTREWARGAYTIKQQGFGMNPKEAKKVRANASLISTAAQYDVPLAKQIAALPLYTNVAQSGRVPMDFERVLAATEVFRDNKIVRTHMVDLLMAWDLGLSDVELKEVTFTDQATNKPIKHHLPFGTHTFGKKRAQRILLDESSGTRGAYVLLSYVLPALAKGGMVVIDEIESDLHPHMLSPILDLFLSRATNPHDAQILFTCHTAEILNMLEKQQIMLVEKDDQGVSDAWRLDTMVGVRKDDNLYAKYMAGAYGAVPRM